MLTPADLVNIGNATEITEKLVEVANTLAEVQKDLDVNQKHAFAGSVLIALSSNYLSAVIQHINTK